MTHDSASVAAQHGGLHPMARLPADWRAVLQSAGQPGYRADQVFSWIHKHGVLDPAGMSNLPREIRTALAASLAPPGIVVDVVRSTDGTRKLVLELRDRQRVECVLIPMPQHREGDSVDGSSQRPHRLATLCVSTQVGCAMGCVFCASGRVGLARGLGPEEIVIQVLLARRYLLEGEVLTNVVFMGMGEPLHFYDATARAIRVMSHPDGLDLSLRRMTVSTVGLIPGIKKLGADFGGRVGLAISLHAPDDGMRSALLPVNRRYPLNELVLALRDYPLPRRRRFTIEYILIRGQNDAESDARALASLLRPIPVKVNLIPMNPVIGTTLRAPTDAAVQRFRDALVARGCSCFVRRRRGDDVAAACGQLALIGQKSPGIPRGGRRRSGAFPPGSGRPRHHG